MTIDIRRAGAGVAAVALIAALALPSDGQPAPRRATPPRPTPPVTAPPGMPGVGPATTPTLPPANASAALPYPAYGSPVPGVNRGSPAPGIPTTITLDQAIAIAVARNPLLAAARADVGIAHANVLLQRTQLLPNIAGSVSASETFRQGGASGVTAATTSSTIGGGTSSGGGTVVVTPATPIAGSGGAGGTASPPATGTGTGTGTGTTTGSAGRVFMQAISPQATTTSAPTTTTTTGGTFLGSGAGGSVWSTNLSLALTLRQLIYDGGRVRANIEAATQSESASANTYKRDLQTVAYNVAVAYYNALAAARTTAVDLEIVREDIVQENLVTAQVRAGTAARTDIATAQLPTAQARVAVVRSQATELASLASFANAMGLDANTLVAPQDDTTAFQSVLAAPSAVPSYDTAIARAYSLRPDLAAQTATVAAATASLRAARLGNFPSLSATASDGTASTSTNASDFRNSSSVGLTLSIPIFDQGITRAQVAQARSTLDLANANLATARNTVQLNVKQALVNLVSARSALLQTQAEYNKAEEVLRATQAQYRAGVTTLPLLLNAQVGVTQALTDQVTAVYTLRQAEQQLLFATGANA